METKEMNIYEKLSNIQKELKCNKSQYNKFGNYYYRSCEDILESVKPLCHKYRLTLVINDVIEVISERYYVKAVATLFDFDSDKTIVSGAYARESLTKKGMDESQITGTSSSYARKYALNGLFNIDDTKDSDTNENKNNHQDEQEDKKATKKVRKETNNDDKFNDDKLEFINKYYKDHREKFGKFLKGYLSSNNAQKVSDLNDNQKDEIIQAINNGKHTFED